MIYESLSHFENNRMQIFRILPKDFTHVVHTCFKFKIIEMYSAINYDR